VRMCRWWVRFLHVRGAVAVSALLRAAHWRRIVVAVPVCLALCTAPALAD
jgi:hypothetical protein